jgi:hypothetical protein
MGVGEKDNIHIVGGNLPGPFKTTNKMGGGERKKFCAEEIATSCGE